MSAIALERFLRKVAEVCGPYRILKCRENYLFRRFPRRPTLHGLRDEILVRRLDLLLKIPIEHVDGDAVALKKRDAPAVHGWVWIMYADPHFLDAGVDNALGATQLGVIPGTGRAGLQRGEEDGAIQSV